MDTPIYTEMIIEAKRRTKRDSPERAALTEMDERTRPKLVTTGTYARLTFDAQGNRITEPLPRRSGAQR